MTTERSLKPHILEMWLEEGHEECLANFRSDRKGNEYCGPGMWFSCYEYSLECPRDTVPHDQRDCALWMECEHTFDDEAFPCEVEAAGGKLCCPWNPELRDFSNTVCGKCEAAGIAEDEWSDTHPHGSFEPDDGCWALFQLGNSDAILDVVDGGVTPDAEDLFFGRHEVYVENEGGFEDGWLALRTKE